MQVIEIEKTVLAQRSARFVGHLAGLQDHQTRFAAPARLGPGQAVQDGLGQREHIRGGGERTQHDAGLGIGEQGGDRVLHQRRSPRHRRAQIEGVGGGVPGRVVRLQSGPRLRGVARQGQRVLGQKIGADRAGAARSRHQARFDARRALEAGQGRRQHNHRIRIVHQHHAGVAAGGGEGRIAARQARGVGKGRGGPAIAAPGLDRQQRFARRLRAPRRLDKAPAVLDPFDVGADHVRRRIVHQKIEEIAELEIGLIADRKAVREADAAGLRPVEERGHQRPRLADQADPPGRKPIDVERRRGAQHEMVRGADQAQAVRPEQTHAVAAGRRHDPGLQPGALGPGVGEFRGDDDGRLRSGPRALAHRRLDVIARHRHHGQVGRPRRGADLWIAADARQGFAPAVDRIDLAAKSVSEQQVEQSSAELAQIVGGADHGD